MTLAAAIEAANDPTALNDLFATLHARGKDTPAKTWWHAEGMHPAIFRALRMDRQEDGSIFAAQPFRLHRGDGTARILAAFPTPRILGDVDMDWLGIDAVVSWDPVTDTAELMGDCQPALVGAIRPDLDSISIHGSPFAYFRAVAEDRAQWVTRRHMISGDWRKRPEEPSSFGPGLLLIGEPDKVRWPLHRMPADVAVHGIDAKALNRAMLRQARVPRAIAAPAMRVAA